MQAAVERLMSDPITLVHQDWIKSMHQRIPRHIALDHVMAHGVEHTSTITRLLLTNELLKGFVVHERNPVVIEQGISY